MSSVHDLPIEPIKRTPFWLRLIGKPPYRRWVWTWVGATEGYWEYSQDNQTKRDQIV